MQNTHKDQTENGFWFGGFYGAHTLYMPYSFKHIQETVNWMESKSHREHLHVGMNVECWTLIVTPKDMQVSPWLHSW